MRDSKDEERLNGENGLLLTPSIDHLFDRGFIGFEDNGTLIKTLRLQRNQQAPQFGLDFLPPYSPDLNPIERVWKLTRRLCLHNRYFGLLDGVVAAVEDQFAEWTKPNDTLRRLCAITDREAIIRARCCRASSSNAWPPTLPCGHGGGRSGRPDGVHADDDQREGHLRHGNSSLRPSYFSCFS